MLVTHFPLLQLFSLDNKTYCCLANFYLVYIFTDEMVSVLKDVYNGVC